VEYQNEHLTIQLDQAPGCLVKLKAKLSPAAVEDTYQKAIKTINKQATLPGFRKGKAPADQIVKKFHDHIDKEWREQVLNHALYDAFDLTKKVPFNRESVKKAQIINCSRADGAELYYEYETAPTVPTIDVSNITLEPVTKMVITPDMVEDAEHQLCLHHAKWTEIVDRPATEGDHVVLMIEDAHSGRLLVEEIGIDVLPDHMGDWMRKLVIGMSPGQTSEGMSENELFPGDSSEETPFQPTLCRITLRGIWHADKPVMDDELAKKAGVESLAVLREKIQQSLENQAVATLQQKRWEQLTKILAQRFPFDLPTSLVKHEISAMTRMHQTDADPRLSEEERKAQLTQAQQKVVEDLHIGFLLRAYFEQNKLTITQTELLQERMEQLLMVPAAQRIISAEMEPEERDKRLLWLIIRKKVKAHMLAQILEK
jgi:trigger factor